MRGKVIVRDGEAIRQALKRLRRQVCSDMELGKWPVWVGH
jgi:ribosomal protein S21